MPVELVRLHDDDARSLFALALNATRREADARDVMQEVFRRLVMRQQTGC